MTLKIPKLNKKYEIKILYKFRCSALNRIKNVTFLRHMNCKFY